MHHNALAAGGEASIGQNTFWSVETVWQAIEDSEKYGNLEERTAILLLADAFLRANECLKAPENLQPRFLSSSVMTRQPSAMPSHFFRSRS